MSSGSGPGSDPHLLALLRAIRLRRSSPEAAEAAAAGAADTTAALSDRAPGAEDEQPEPADPPVHPAPYGLSAYRGPAATGPGGAATGAGEPPASGGADLPDTPAGSAPTPAAGRAVQPATGKAVQPATGKAVQPAAGRGAAPSSTGRGSSELLWRGGQGAALGRSGLEPAPRRRAPGLPGAQAAWGVPISGVSPTGPTAPVSNVPPVPGARPIGGAGTEFPAVGQYPGRAAGPPPPLRRLPSADGMDPADDAALRDTQRLLSTSLTFAGGTGEVAVRLRAALEQAAPELLATLPGTARSQTEQLSRALIWLVHNFDNPPAVVAGCGMLGAALAECGVRWNQLHLVGAAVAEAMRAGMAPGAGRQDFDQAWRWSWQHAYEWMAHGASLVDYQPTVWTATVVSHELCRPDLAVLRLRVHLPMPFRPGQYARVEVDGLPGVWRPYSLPGAPHRDGLLELHVRAKTETGASGTLVYGTAEGDQVRLRRPEGQMGLPAEPGRGVLMIAGDTGVAPMKAMLAELAATGEPREAVLFWGVRDQAQLYDIDELTELARRAARATVVPVIAEGDPGPYASGLVTDAVAAYGEWSRHEVYLAGPPLMLAATSAALRQLGVAAERIHHDVPE